MLISKLFTYKMIIGKNVLEIQPGSNTMKTSLFLLIMLGSYFAVAQSSEEVEMRNAK